MPRKFTVPLILMLIWLVILGWQVIDHHRFKDNARTALLNRARDITNSLATVIRSMRRFGGVISKNRLEQALQDLSRQEDLRSIALLNALGEVVTSAGETTQIDIEDLPHTGERWGRETVTFVNLVDLGVDPEEPHTGEPRTLILPLPEPRRDDRDTPPPPPGQGPPPPFSDGPPPPDFMNRSPDSVTDALNSATPSELMAQSRDRRGGDRFRRPPWFGRPVWMDESQYQSLLEKQGLHGFVLVLSTQAYNASLSKDLWMRSTIAGFSLLAMVGIGVAWRNQIKTGELQLRLVRASEMNANLREMNIAAAGLAHETRNPLNIVRGLAQMIAKQPGIPEETRERSVKITEEVDRVTAQLNEFIDYSKPREPKPAPVAVHAVIQDVERALRTDLEDNAIQFHLSGPELTVDADESLLRQVVFNLLINAIQSVPPGGRVEITTGRSSPTEGYLDIRDNGPGVPEENRDIIFQPYFTTHSKGTGLGLAVVRQIVMSHGWTVEYVSPPDGGALFHIGGMRIL
ncbi:MAG TPA: ATP-binding protein [bacterium]|nr:ATP-binding protein [bacterium]HOL96078.1 ATP-binding protein [bacterium]